MQAERQGAGAKREATSVERELLGPKEKGTGTIGVKKRGYSTRAERGALSLQKRRKQN